MPLPSEFSIRPAVPEDVGTLLHMVRALAVYENLLHEVVATEEDYREQLFGPNRRAEALIACEHGKPVGLAIYFHNFSTFLGKPGLYVEDIFVPPEHRGKGYGKALMIALAQIAVERGCGRFEWTVLDWNQPSIDFYRSLGAEPKSEWIIQRVSGKALEDLAAREAALVRTQ